MGSAKEKTAAGDVPAEAKKAAIAQNVGTDTRMTAAAIKVPDIKIQIEAQIDALIGQGCREEKTYRAVLRPYAGDTRSSAAKLLVQEEKRITRLMAEFSRIEKMKQFEYKYADLAAVCGIDEVGRGPLAGPVMACAVILPKNSDILYLNDSKQLTEKKREELFTEIMNKAVAVGTGCISHEIIDKVNILQATFLAMKQAVEGLSVKPDLLLVDAVHIPDVPYRQVGIVKGDARSVSIAAASIVAKVTRDHMMVEYDRLYPGYGFASNKGYGSEEHLNALKTLGPCPIHRMSFLRNIPYARPEEEALEQTAAAGEEWQSGEW